MDNRMRHADAVNSELAHPLRDDLTWLLSRVWLGFGDARTAALSGLGLTVREHALLQVLQSVDGTQLEIAELMRVDKSMVTTTIDALEKRNLVRRVADPRDRRAKRPEPTAEGRALCLKADQLSRESQEPILAELGNIDRERFVEMLRGYAFGAFSDTRPFASGR